MIKFFYNGVKVNGKLTKAHIYETTLTNGETVITVCARNYSRFPAEVHEHFTVENKTDTQSDYFDHDRLRVSATHPMYAEVANALAQIDLYTAKRRVKAEAKAASRVAARYVYAPKLAPVVTTEPEEMSDEELLAALGYVQLPLAPAPEVDESLAWTLHILADMPLASARKAV